MKRPFPYSIPLKFMFTKKYNSGFVYNAFKNFLRFDKFLIGIFSLMLISGFWSCETDVDLNDEWQDIPVVYGLLSQNDQVHYIRINRAFLGEGDAMKMASELDSIIYDPKNLDVRLIEMNGDNPVRSIPLDTTLVTNVDSGVFHYPEQIVYRTQPNSVELSTNYTYHLEIYNKKYDKYIESETELIHDFSIKRPLAGQTMVNYTSPFPTDVIWRTAENGRLHQLSIRIYYTNYFDSGNTERKTLNWNFPSKEASDLGGGEEQKTQIRGQQFYVFLKNSIPERSDVERTLDSVRYIVSVANDNFNIYMKVNEPSNSIIQERPEFSNVSNGIGLFASRYSEHRTLLLNSDSQDSLVDGHHTRHLNFIKPIR
ncbi:MAG: hypothetical protein K9I29_01750 [Bacteroidales bacterium]|nr:hypothetical protein [Bacteroidales bacterium]MCF8326995.1 hypothetical protein [Bacteroidales bacterium]